MSKDLKPAGRKLPIGHRPAPNIAICPAWKRVKTSLIGIGAGEMPSLMRPSRNDTALFTCGVSAVALQTSLLVRLPPEFATQGMVPGKMSLLAPVKADW